MKTHDLKVWPEFFQGLADGTKTFEVRKDDRDFAVDDVLLLREFDPEDQTYTGEFRRRIVGYKLEGGQHGVAPGYCILGFRVLGFGQPDA